MAKPKHTLVGPQRAAVQAALARRQLEIRTLAALQSHLTADTTREVLARLKGTDPENELPLKEGPSRPFVRKGGRTSRYRGATRHRNKWVASIQRGGVQTQLGSYE